MKGFILVEDKKKPVISERRKKVARENHDFGNLILYRLDQHKDARERPGNRGLRGRERGLQVL